MRRILFIFVVLLYSLYINVLYELVGSTFYDVQGYDFKLSIENEYVLFCSLIGLIPAFFFSLKRSLPSAFVLIILYLIHVIPSIMFFPHYLELNLEGMLWIFFISFSFSIFLVLYNITAKFAIPILKLKELKILTKNYYLLIFLVSTIIFFSLLLYFKGFKSISIFHVYEIRQLYKENLNRIIAYVVINVGYILSPFLILMSIAYKKFFSRLIFAALGLLLSLLIFTNTGFKSVAFMWIYVVYWFFFLKKFNTSHLALKITLGFVFFIWVIHLLGILFSLDFLYLHWIRRLVLSAGMNTTYFYDFIITNGIEYLKNAPNIISLYYFGTDGSANTGIIGDGFTRYLYVGIILNYLVLFIILKLLDSIYIKLKDSNLKFVFISLMFPIAYALSYSKTSSVIFTYGLLLIVILFYGGMFFERKNLPHNNCSSRIRH